MCYTTWSKNGFSTETSDESLKAMQETGVNCVQIVVTWYQETFRSTDIKRLDRRTPSDKSIIHAIRKAHEYGMSVMLKPHVDLVRQEDSYRADIGFSSEAEWEEWFSNYTKFIKHYAQIAEKEGVELFCIGTELSYAASKTEMWKNIVIPEVRKTFSGNITYAANWDNYKNIEFWSEVNYAGIDAYFPLSNKDNPTFQDLKEGWKRWLIEIEQWQKTIDKPVIFTECGYASSDIAARRPWAEPFSGEPNLKIQVDCYRALLETFCGKSWFYGLYWWKWNTYAGSGGKNHRRFTPQNKPAMNLVRLWYTHLIRKDS